MDKLQWFKFSPTDWVMGKIQKTPEITQARFLKLACLYWNKECVLSVSDAEIEVDKEHLDILINKKVIKISGENIVIDFLDEQLLGVKEISEANRNNVKKRWEEHKKRNSVEQQPNTNELPSNTTVLRNDTEKIREDKRRRDKIYITPSLNDVYSYFKEKGYSEESAKKFFDYYEAGGWSDSKGKKVKNWKQKALGVWFKPENLISVQQQQEKYDPLKEDSPEKIINSLLNR